MTDIENIKAIVKAFDEGRTALTKFAFTPTASPAPPATAMPPQGPPPPPPAGGIPPELEGALSQLAGGMDTVSQTVEQQQAQTDQLSQSMLAIEEELNNL